MVSISTLLLVASGLLVAQAASGCNNPLFDKAQWPSGYTRPPFLTEPGPWQQDDPPICPEVSSSSACCNAETAAGIGTNYIEYLGNWYNEWISVDGVIQDIFNDFNPVIQQQKLDYGWTENGSGSSDSGVSASGSASTTTNTASSTASTSYEAEKPDKATIEAAFSAEPADGVPDSYASIDLTGGDYVWYDFWPYGRAKSRSRTGLLKLSNSTQTEVRKKVNDMNGYMMQLSFYNYQCQQAFKQHMVGMLCMGCDPNWGDWVQSSANSIKVLISDDSCSALYDSCKAYLRLYQDTPTLVTAMTAAVKKTITADSNYSQYASSIYLSDLDTIINAKSAELCNGKSECKTLLCTSFATGTSGLFPDRKLIADPAGLIAGKRELVSTVALELDSSGYDAMQAGKGEASIIIPVMYATAEGTSAPGVSTDNSSGSRTAPFSDSIDAALVLSVSATLLSLALANY